VTSTAIYWALGAALAACWVVIKLTKTSVKPISAESAFFIVPPMPDVMIMAPKSAKK